MSEYYNGKLGRDIQFYTGRLGRNGGLGRKRGDWFIGLADLTHGYYNNILALTYKEIAASLAGGALLGVAIPIARSLLGI
ncbi:hypothetical protein HZA75_01075 [Candidatus Roizmanbacteria bacterium]|nr:hypothetical protein [Candidatus Roizmanbacteria bacterium]